MISKSVFARTFGCLVLAAAIPSVALANDKDKNHADKTHATAAAASVEGTVEAITNKDMTVKDTSGQMMKVEINKSTQFDNSGKTGALKDLRAGMNVTIQGQKEKDGTVKATSVRYDKNAPVNPS